VSVYALALNYVLKFKSFKDPSALKRHHVVVTTYDTLKSEYQAYSPPAKDESTATLKKKTPDESEDESDDSFVRSTKKKTATGKKEPKKKCAIYKVKWIRVVLGVQFSQNVDVCWLIKHSSYR